MSKSQLFLRLWYWTPSSVFWSCKNEIKSNCRKKIMCDTEGKNTSEETMRVSWIKVNCCQFEYNLSTISNCYQAKLLLYGDSSFASPIRNCLSMGLLSTISYDIYQLSQKYMPAYILRSVILIFTEIHYWTGKQSSVNCRRCTLVTISLSSRMSYQLNVILYIKILEFVFNWKQLINTKFGVLWR